MLRLHVPMLEMGNGFGVLQDPTLWITVGGKPRSGGMLIMDAGVLAVTGKVTLLVLGSLLLIVNVHDLDPPEVGVNLTVRFRQELALTVAGKGLLTSVKSLPREIFGTPPSPYTKPGSSEGDPLLSSTSNRRT